MELLNGKEREKMEKVMLKIVNKLEAAWFTWKGLPKKTKIIILIVAAGVLVYIAQ